MSNVVFEADKVRLKTRLLIGVVGAVLVIALLLSFESSALVIPALIVFAVLGGRGLWRFVRQLRNSELVVLDEEGITDRSYGLGFVPWGNVRAARLHDLERMGKTYRVIELTLRDPEAFFEDKTVDRSLIRRGMSSGTTGVWVNTWQLKASADEVLDTIRDYISRYSEASSAV